MRRVSLGLSLALGAFSGTVLPAQHVFAQAAPGGDELVPLAQAIDAKPDQPESYDAYAQACFRARRWDEAIARLKLGVARIPAYHAGWYKLGYAYRQKRSFAESAVAYRRYAELEPAKSDPYFGLGAALQGAGDRAGAVAAYRRYLELETAPEKQKFVVQAREEIAKLERSDASAAVVDVPPQPAAKPAASPAPVTRPVVKPAPIVQASPPAHLVTPPRSDALALRAAADKHRQAGRLDEAAVGFEGALAADPGNLDLHVELGDVYFAQKRYGDAARVFRLAVERDRGYALGWYNLAHAQARVGEHAGAVAAYREYIRLRPTDPDPFYGLGMTYKAMNDSKAAIDAFRTYLRMETRPEVQRWIDRARRELDVLEGGGPHSRSSGDLKNPFEDRPAYASMDELLPPGDQASRRDHERIERELAADDILPINSEVDDALVRGSRDLKDPFAGEGGDRRAASNRERLSRYASALAAYRAALDRHAGEVAVLYQRGAEHVLANDLRGALRAWSIAAPADRSLEDARARLEKAHDALVR